MTYVHCVFFTIKEGTPASAVDAQIADGTSLLGQIPTVRELKTGRRDETVNREVSVTDYEIGLMVLFNDKADSEVYADHPLHLEYIAKNKANWTQVRVCDFETA